MLGKNYCEVPWPREKRRKTKKTEEKEEIE